MSNTEDSPLLKPGLFVVGTPIGNRRDLSPRAEEVLRHADLIACEDTRHARQLLNPLGITTPTIPYHDHNETAQAHYLATKISEGKSIALISDAGMPGISDPGFRIVRDCRSQNLPIFAVPGPTALTTALAISGLPTDQFFFFGFLPPKSSARKRNLETYRDAEATLVFYESTHRIEKFLNDIIEVLGPDRIISIGRELTKLFETVHTGSAQQVLDQLSNGSKKGEFVVMIAKSTYTL